MVEGQRFMRKLAASPALAEITESELTPGSDVQSDDEIVAFVREAADTVYHPVSTCRMGSDPKTSVVNNKLQVHGLHKLRVVDASVFPTVTSGNTNAPTIMIAEKAADIILDDHANCPSGPNYSFEASLIASLKLSPDRFRISCAVDLVQPIATKDASFKSPFAVLTAMAAVSRSHSLM